MTIPHRVRFAFTIAQGPNAGLTNGGWRLWVHGESTYLTNTSFGGVWKVSLHADSSWRLAVTQEHLRSGAEPTMPAWLPRAPWRFTPTPIEGGGRLAFVVAVPRSVLLPQPLSRRELHVRVKDRWDQVTLARVHITEPGVRLDTRRLIAGPLVLASGRQVWLSAAVEDIEVREPEQLPDALVVEPRWQEEHGVPAPGLVVRAAHFG